MASKILYVAIAAIIASTVLALTTMSPPSTDSSTDSSTIDTIPDLVNIGVMLPATGDLSSHGQDNSIAIELGVADFNKHLESIGETWQMNLIVEDTQTDPIVALEKIQSLNSKGIRLILGTETSAELRNIKSYADSNNMLLISPSSTAPKLAIDDNIYRLIPDDTKQGKVIAELLSSSDIKAVIPIYRGDVWGDGLFEQTKISFEQLGGLVDDGIRYNPEIAVFSTEAEQVSNIVTSYLLEYPVDEVAVLMIGFDEVVHFFNSANSYDVLHSVQWFGSDASTNDDGFISDPIALAFATDVSFISSQVSASTNEKFQRVRDHLIDTVGFAPNNYAYSSYDSVWLLGLAILETQSIDALRIGDALSVVAKDYTGAIGKIVFNEFGDLDISDYELFTIADGKWISYGRYDSASNTIIVY